MQIIVINGPLPEQEQDVYISHVTRRCPASAIDKLYIEVHEDHVDHGGPVLFGSGSGSQLLLRSCSGLSSILVTSTE